MHYIITILNFLSFTECYILPWLFPLVLDVFVDVFPEAGFLLDFLFVQGLFP